MEDHVNLAAEGAAPRHVETREVVDSLAVVARRVGRDRDSHVDQAGLPFRRSHSSVRYRTNNVLSTQLFRIFSHSVPS